MNSYQPNDFLSSIASAQAGGGGPGVPTGAPPANTSQWANVLGQAASIYFNDRQSQRDYNTAKLEYKTLSLYAQLQGLNSEGYQPGQYGAGGAYPAQSPMGLETMLVLGLVWYAASNA